jgi:hypothetical protein
MMDANQAKSDADLNEITARLEVEMNTIQEEMENHQDKMDGRQEVMQAQMAFFASRVGDNNEVSEILRDTLVSRVDAHQKIMMRNGIRSGASGGPHGTYRCGNCQRVEKAAPEPASSRRMLPKTPRSGPGKIVVTGKHWPPPADG